MASRVRSQKTVKNTVYMEGVGLHSGKMIQLAIRPAKPNVGVLFVRNDVRGAPMISGHYRSIVATQLATTIGNDRTRISTVEHLLAAFQGLGLDNAIVEVNGPEIPILDGSSIEFCQAILEVGVVDQAAFSPRVYLERPLEVKIGNKSAVAEPCHRLEIHSSIEWKHPAIGAQSFSYIEGYTDFTELASARTFGFLKDVEALRKMGLARGGSLKNAIVLDDEKVLNPEGLRHPDEFVRHKVLDTLGDLKLAGFHLAAKLTLKCSGHDLHHRLMSEIFRDPANYRMEEEVRLPLEAAI